MSRSLAALMVVALGAAPSSAQTTRAEAIAQEQARKAASVAPEGPSDAEQVVVRVLSSPLLATGDGPYPWFGSIFGGTGLAIGAGYSKRLPHNASAHALAGVSVNNSRLVQAGLTAPELWRGRLRVDAGARWMEAKDVSYFGWGALSTEDRRQPYRYRPTELTASIIARPRRWAFATAGYARLDIASRYDDEVRVAWYSAPGVGLDLGYHVARASAGVDWRPASAYSTRGGLYRVGWDRYIETTAHGLAFSATEFEAAQLVPLAREQFVLAFRGLVTLTHAGAGEQVPVMLAPHLGSGSTLRGFANRRFTDRHRALVQGEYRWRPSRYVDMALFLDAGQVAGEARALRLGDFETSYGIGLRAHGPSFTAFRLELARSREGWKAVVSGAQPF